MVASVHSEVCDRATTGVSSIGPARRSACALRLAGPMAPSASGGRCSTQESIHPYRRENNRAYEMLLKRSFDSSKPRKGGGSNETAAIKG
jgi:hypothetical protein